MSTCASVRSYLCIYSFKVHAQRASAIACMSVCVCENERERERARERVGVLGRETAHLFFNTMIGYPTHGYMNRKANAEFTCEMNFLFLTSKCTSTESFLVKNKTKTIA